MDNKKTVNYEAVLKAEKEYLKTGEQTSALAVSGGGIRSASFGLGVMQALVANRQLSKMDYLSTVSGGGYLGSALTWALNQANGTAGTDPENFPLGKRQVKGAREGEDNKLLDFIRQHSSYLLPVSKLGAVSFGAVVLRSMLLALFVYTTILTVIMVVCKWCHLFDTVSFTFAPGKLQASVSLLLIVAVALVGLFLVMNLVYSLVTFFSRSESSGTYLGLVRWQQTLGVLWQVVIAFVFIGMMPHIHHWLSGDFKPSITAGGSTLAGIATGIWQYMKAQKKDTSSGMMSDMGIYLGAIALAYGLLLFGYIIATNIIGESVPMFIGLCAVALVFGLLVNLNLVGPHRVWRDRLMEAFMPNKTAVNDNKWEPATEADKAMMKDMCNASNPRPYHIVNTNIILVDSPTVKYRGRGGDNFIISPMYCGSDATEWIRTADFQKKGGRGITLATAMATSAAALNPNAGVSGEGLTRNSVVSILLSVLNLRLGYWTTNPKHDPSVFPPNFFVPGVSHELQRSGLHETSRNILLSDGGHFENLGIYELVRRRVNLIVLSDGGADVEFNFDDLANAVEKVRVDFGAKISFKDSDLNDILGGTAGDSLFDKKYNIAKRGYAIGQILYSDGKKGTLVYIKLAMIPELPTDIYSYKGINPTFPHQSTADQFFNEKQFEAYRELGYNVAWKMMESEEGKKIFPSEATRSLTEKVSPQ